MMTTPKKQIEPEEQGEYIDDLETPEEEAALWAAAKGRYPVPKGPIEKPTNSKKPFVREWGKYYEPPVYTPEEDAQRAAIIYGMFHYATKEEGQANLAKANAWSDKYPGDSGILARNKWAYIILSRMP